MARVSFLIGYDIADNKRRARFLRMLRANSLSYQDSFFEVVTEQRDLQSLMKRLVNMLDPEEDRLFCLRLSKGYSRWQLGTGGFSPDGPLFLIR